MDPRDTSKHRQAVNDLQPYRSRMLLSPRVRLDWKRSSAVSVSGAGVLLSALYQASRYADPAGLGVIGEQLSVDVESYLEWFDGLLTARARVADLFDARRTDVVGYPLPGRSVYLGIEAHY
jgi:iron complex outermembrane receptor protein